GRTDPLLGGRGVLPFLLHVLRRGAQVVALPREDHRVSGATAGEPTDRGEERGVLTRQREQLTDVVRERKGGSDTRDSGHDLLLSGGYGRGRAASFCNLS